MQKNDMARKIKTEIDGAEITNLVQIGEINREQVTVEVPSFDKLINIITGVDQIPPIDAGYKFTRNSDTFEFFKNWYTQNEIKDVVLVETDGTGSEIQRVTLAQCELSKFTVGEYDAASPTYYRVDVTFLPANIDYI